MSAPQPTPLPRSADELVFVVPYGPGGASADVRVRGWIEHLGLRAEVLDYVGSRNNRPRTLVTQPLDVARAEWRLRRLARRPLEDAALLINREASPFTRGGLEARLLARAGRGIYDFDDALQWDATGDPWRSSLFSKAETCRRSVEAADVVLAGSEVLAEWAAGHNDDVVLVPSCVEPSRYPRKTSYGVPERPTVLWLGSPSTEEYLRAIAEPLLQTCRRTGARVRVISSGSASLGALDEVVDRVEWSPAAVRRELPAADVAVAPLIDGPFERGKCAYKLLQYGATGLPVVGSPVGANALALDRLGGSAVTQPSEWVDALTGWLGAPESERERAGRTAESAVQQHYSYEAWATVWLRAVGSRA
jgi:glycosyltransferase involved in cell wall biosynthesis